MKRIQKSVPSPTTECVTDDRTLLNMRMNARRSHYMVSLLCLLKKKRFAAAMAARDGGGGVLMIRESLSLLNSGCLNCKADFS
jgi:hypothetical protein